MAQMRWTPVVRQLEPRLKVCTVGFDVGSDRGQRAGWCDDSTFNSININFFFGCGAHGYVGEGEHFLAPRAGSGSGGAEPIGKAGLGSRAPQT